MKIVTSFLRKFYRFPIGTLFSLQPEKNIFLGFILLLFNIVAACLEGLSFIFILASFAVLTGEALPSLPLFLSLPIPPSFVNFLCSAIVLQILRSGCCYCVYIMLSTLTIHSQDAAQRQIFRKIFHMDYPQISKMKKGDLLHQATAPPSFIPLLFEGYNHLLTAAFMMCAYLLIMLHISYVLTLIVTVVFLLVATLQKWFFKAISKASHLQSDQITELSQHTAQSLEGLKLIHICHGQERTLKKMELILDKISLATKKLKKINALIPALNDSLGVIVVGFSLLIGTYILRQSTESYISSLFIYLTLTYRMATRLQQLMVAKGTIASYLGPFKQMKNLINHPIAPLTPPFGDFPSLREALTIENLSMAYTKGGIHTLKNISLTIPKNKITALVGLSGAGKSTIIDLLIRLYEPLQGKIKLDGVSIQHYPLQNWRALFGVVSQDAFLFHDTIEANIRFGHPEATEEQVIQAAQLSGADHFIQSLPQKYKTIVGERGLRLSGGEKQRIALAQALVRNPEILLLDEATSHLDSHSESMIQNTVLQLSGHKTFLIVAHRLATIQMADLIYVIEKGEIVETGNHHELLLRKGRYHLFWNLQQPHLSQTVL